MAHAGKALIDPHVVFEKVELREGMQVADLGCGRTGHFVFSASRVVGERGVVYAVEIVKDILESIRSRVRSEGYYNVQTVWSNIELPGKTPIPDNHLQVCFLVNVLYLIKNRLPVLQEAVRMLESGGRLAVIDWEKNLGMLGPSAEAMIKPEEIKNLAAQAGLEFQESLKVGDYHFCLIFKKK